MYNTVAYHTVRWHHLAVRVCRTRLSVFPRVIIRVLAGLAADPLMEREMRCLIIKA
jgi:hypothetical protein